MAYKYLCLDDEAPEKVGPLLDNVTDAFEGQLDIEHEYPDSFEAQIQLVKKRAGEGELSGLIIDLRLDQAPPTWVRTEEEKSRPKYRAMALAQEIRTQSAEKNFGKEVPIVLWSYEHRLRKSYMTDDTGHDLFDMKVEKDDLTTSLELAKSTGKRLISLVDGYSEILSTRSKKGGPGTQFHKFVGLDDASLLDPRIMSYFEGHETPIPAHEYARFIKRQLLDVPGPLVSEDILAARLGVAISSSGDWSELLQEIPQEAAYRGPFSGGWPRWWARKIDQWWDGLKNSPGRLRRLKAEERVNFLRDTLGLPNLEAAAPIEEHYSTRYWTVCQGSNAPMNPLDPVNGLMVDRRDKKPWQDDLYISEKRALAGAKKDEGLRIDPLHRARLQELKEN